MMLGIHPSRRSLSDYYLASHETELVRSSHLTVNNSYKYYNCYCEKCSMEKRPNILFNSDCVSDSLFMYQHSSSTLLSQASSPSPMDPMLPVRVENIEQPDDLAPHSVFANYSLFNDFPLSDDFTIDEENGEETGEDVKENISVESLLLNGLTCSQLSEHGGDSQIYSQALSSQSQRSQNTQRSQENPNVLQVKSLDNSILSSSYENYSQPLLIASQSSYHGSSSIYGSTYNPNGSQSLTQTDSQHSQQQYSQEGNCCRKHKKYFEKLASNKTEKNIDIDFIIDIDILYATTLTGHLKPPFSHNMLCALAINSEPTRQQEVSGVYKFLMQCFPYFEDAGQHWKNSLRHSLATCDWFEKSDHPRTAKKGYKYTVKSSRMNCLRCEIKKQSVTDLSKLHYRLSGPYVCEYLISMGLLALSQHKMAELRQAIRRHANYAHFPAIEQ